MSAFEVIDICLKAYSFMMMAGACFQHCRGYEDDAIFYMAFATFLLVWRIM